MTMVACFLISLFSDRLMITSNLPVLSYQVFTVFNPKSVSHKPVVPKLFRAVTQSKVAIRSYYPQYIAVIAHNIEQNCGFDFALPPEKSHITLGGNLALVWEPLAQTYDYSVHGERVPSYLQ